MVVKENKKTKKLLKQKEVFIKKQQLEYFKKFLSYGKEKKI